MSQINMSEEKLNPHLDELSEILDSQLSNKEVHVDRLKTAYKDSQEEIDEVYQTWVSLSEIQVPLIGSKMDADFYKMLSNEIAQQPKTAIEVEKKSQSGLPKYLKMGYNIIWTIAATFLLGLLIGNWMNIGKSTPMDNNAINETASETEISFASFEMTPSASDRIKGINEIKDSESLNLKLIEALNKVILNDPNVNVRLTAIETMSMFAHIPEARQYLIEAIPHQQSSIVQLELADIMISLQETESADEWKELLSSEYMENDVKNHLEENLKTIL